MILKNKVTEFEEKVSILNSQLKTRSKYEQSKHLTNGDEFYKEEKYLLDLLSNDSLEMEIQFFSWTLFGMSLLNDEMDISSSAGATLKQIHFVLVGISGSLLFF